MCFLGWLFEQVEGISNTVNTGELDKTVLSYSSVWAALANTFRHIKTAAHTNIGAPGQERETYLRLNWTWVVDVLPLILPFVFPATGVTAISILPMSSVFKHFWCSSSGIESANHLDFRCRTFSWAESGFLSLLKIIVHIRIQVSKFCIWILFSTDHSYPHLFTLFSFISLPLSPVPNHWPYSPVFPLFLHTRLVLQHPINPCFRRIAATPTRPALPLPPGALTIKHYSSQSMSTTALLNSC